MKVLERGYVCEERVLLGKGLVKYGVMLFRLFEMLWEKNYLLVLKFWDIFIFILFWRLFV